MPYNRSFRKRLLQPHAYQSLYFDADLVKPLKGEQLFNPAHTHKWAAAARGTKRFAHPVRCDPQDPLYMMLLVDGLMRIDIGSRVNSNNMTAFMNEWYPHVVWTHLNTAKLLTILYDNQVESGADPKKPPIVMSRIRDYKVYDLHPERETYIWLAEVRERLHKYNQHFIRREYLDRVVRSSAAVFPRQVLWRPKDPDDRSSEILTKM